MTKENTEITWTEIASGEQDDSAWRVLVGAASEYLSAQERVFCTLATLKRGALDSLKRNHDDV